MQNKFIKIDSRSRDESDQSRVQGLLRYINVDHISLITQDLRNPDFCYLTILGEEERIGIKKSADEVIALIKEAIAQQ